MCWRPHSEAVATDMKLSFTFVSQFTSTNKENKHKRPLSEAKTLRPRVLNLSQMDKMDLVLHMHTGMPILVTKNLFRLQGLTNGAQGEILTISFSTQDRESCVTPILVASPTPSFTMFPICYREDEEAKRYPCEHRTHTLTSTWLHCH